MKISHAEVAEKQIRSPAKLVLSHDGKAFVSRIGLFPDDYIAQTINSKLSNAEPRQLVALKSPPDPEESAPSPYEE